MRLLGLCCVWPYHMSGAKVCASYLIDSWWQALKVDKGAPVIQRERLGPWDLDPCCKGTSLLQVRDWEQDAERARKNRLLFWGLKAWLSHRPSASVIRRGRLWRHTKVNLVTMSAEDATHILVSLGGTELAVGLRGWVWWSQAHSLAAGLPRSDPSRWWTGQVVCVCIFKIGTRNHFSGLCKEQM